MAEPKKSDVYDIYLRMFINTRMSLPFRENQVADYAEDGGGALWPPITAAESFLRQPLA